MVAEGLETNAQEFERVLNHWKARCQVAEEKLAMLERDLWECQQHLVAMNDVLTGKADE